MSERSRELADLAERAAREAGAVALAGFRSQGLEITEKRDFHDLVTEYDGLSEIRAREIIEAGAPGSRIVGEEGGETGDSSITWYVDPIDGTSNFARGIALWSVCIAAAIDDEVVAGVVYDPVADEMFRADATGAFLNGIPIRAVGASVPERATVLATFPPPANLRGERRAKLEAYAALTETFAHVRDLGSAGIQICHVAAGWADAVFGFGIKPWDVAAAAFILRQAGGRYWSYADGARQPPTGDHHHPHYCGTVAGAEFPQLDALMRLHTRTPSAHPAEPAPEDSERTEP